MIKFQCDSCGSRFFSAAMMYCNTCGIVLCEKCTEFEKKGVKYDKGGDLYKHCGREYMGTLKSNEHELLEVMLTNDPDRKWFVTLLLKDNMVTANRLLKQAMDENWKYEDLPDNVRYPYSYAAERFRYLVRHEMI